MNVSLAQDLSVYQLALSVQTPPQPLSLSPATLLSLVRSQIDLLISQQIAATLWVKLPPGKIWRSEIQRYQSSVDVPAVIYTCKIEENALLDKEKNLTPHQRQKHPTPHNQLGREYFLMVLSPQFCSLILVYRSLKKPKNHNSKKVTDNQNPLLLGMTTFEGKVIQHILDGVKQAITPECPIIPANFICPPAPKPALISQLLTKQIQRQDEINRHITTERLAKLQGQNEKLHTKERLKDEYLSNVCQELRTPLTHMKTALSLLNSPNLKPPQKQRYLQMLNTQCDRQNSLITGLLDLVQLERNLEGTSLESVRLSDIVPGVVSTYQPVAQEKGIMLAYTVPSELPAVWCVTGGLRQIVINLLHNSIKFTPNGGQVWVRGRLQGDFVQLEFRDTGIGIAESDISKIFDRFYRVRPVAEDSGGAGLGLTIVQHLLWRCGGSISVKSKLSEGSTFTVQLAIAPAEPPG
ncbi:MAG: DICT sensory domain-containing protein [Heteroscytonema crispum UTEX LB 1556]